MVMEKKRWKQKGFIISTFSGGDNYNTLKLLKEANFNMVEFTFKPRETVTRALEACESLQLPSLVQDKSFCGIGNGFAHADDDIVKEAVDYYSRFKQILGFYVWDEPTHECFEECRNTTDLFRKHAPDKLAFSVVFPSYGVYTWSGSAYNWEQNTYVQYIDGYLKTVDPDVFSMDHYVFQVNRGIHELKHYTLWKDLGYCRKRALELNKPLWFYYQGLGHFDPPDKKDYIYDMTPAKIRVQMSAALAYGVKQLSCFTAAGLIFDSDGVKTHMYEPVKEINARIQKIGDFLFDKTSTKLYHTDFDAEEAFKYFLDNINEDDLIEEAEKGLILGRFKGAGDSEYLVIVNREFEKRARGVLRLKGIYDIRQFCDESGELIPMSRSNAICYDLAEGSCSVYELTL